MKSVFRVTRLFKYAFLFLAGVAGVLLSTSLLQAGIGPVYAILWSISMCSGAALSFYGTIRKQWTGEYIGLPLIISCLFLLASVCFFPIDATSVPRVFLGLLFLGFTFSTAARRSDVKFQKRLADYESRKKRGLVGL